MIHRFSILLVFAAGLSACAATQGRAQKLNEAVYYFNEGVRWGRVQDVLARLDPAASDHFREMHKDFGNTIKITNYELVDQRLDMDEGAAYFAIQLTWYREDELVVRETVVAQHWEEKKLEWFMVREEYQSGTPF